MKELSKTRDVLDSKLQFKGVFNPLGALAWDPSEFDINSMKEKLSKEVCKSTVPDSIKDQHSDQSYNHLKPYDQDIRTFLDDSSFALYLHQLESLSKALRNSDYADADCRKRALKEVIGGWTEVSKILFVLTPILANNGFATFEGHGFHLSDDFKKDETSVKQLFISILCANPHNVVKFLKDDLSSDRIGPLIYDLLSSNPNALTIHLLIRFLISERPKGWSKEVEKYILALDKNSFYLSDILGQLKGEYRYGYSEGSNERSIELAIKTCIAKHEISKNTPTSKDLARVTVSR